MTPRTYKTRRRRLSPARLAAWTHGLERWGLDPDGGPLDLATEFGPDFPRHLLDIGVGGGESTLQAARDEPSVGIVAVEVHTPGIARILDEISAVGLRNVRVVEGDVLQFLERLPPSCLDEVRILFPDPWPKQRHRHRRLVRDDVVVRLVDRLRPHGVLHLATDHPAYAADMRSVLDRHPRLHGGLVPRPTWRVQTRYELRGIQAGRAPVDLHYCVEVPPLTT